MPETPNPKDQGQWLHLNSEGLLDSVKNKEYDFFDQCCLHRNQPREKEQPGQKLQSDQHGPKPRTQDESKAEMFVLICQRGGGTDEEKVLLARIRR